MSNRKFYRLCYILFLIPALANAQPEIKQRGPGTKGFGNWETDASNLPCFVTNLETNPVPWYSFGHMMGTGKAMFLTNQWGAVNFYFVGSRGMINITPSTYKTRSGFYPMLETDKGLYSLVYQELNARKKLTYGIGYTLFQGELVRDHIHVKVSYSVYAAFDSSSRIYGNLEIENLSELPLKARVRVRSDIWPRKDFPDFERWLEADKKPFNERGGTGFGDSKNYGEIYLAGEPDWLGTSKENVLELSKSIELKTHSKTKSNFVLGVEDPEDKSPGHLPPVKAENVTTAQQSWKTALKPVRYALPEKWMADECLWSYSQLLSFCFYDPSLQEYIINLGGYGMASDVSVPAESFGMREIAETAMILSYFNPALAKSSIRWLSKLQLSSGDLPREHNYTRIERKPASVIFNGKFPSESDTEIWYLLAIGEYINTTKDYHFLGDSVDFLTIGGTGSIWDHAKAAFHFIRKYIKTGNHGLIRILNGDWNDYLSKIGSGDHGESMMNTGMLCRALNDLSLLAKKKGDLIFAEEIQSFNDSLKTSSQKVFDQGWFIRGFDDRGHSIGSYADRLFLNAQSWACLGNCGNEQMRKTSLKNTLLKCQSRIGLTLMSRPYSSPAPDISWAPIEQGEGENAGIWPQTVHWTIWALAEAGMQKEAMEEWKKISLRNHAHNFPQVPFGIFNGPDCYSSHFAGNREGWTQTGTFNRMLEMPMNPMIAWQAFSMKKILENRK